MKAILLAAAIAALPFHTAFANVKGSSKQSAGESASSRLNDGQIAKVLETVNSIDVKMGKMAEKKSENPQVKQFAKTMVSDHSSVNKQAKDVSKSAKLKPAESAASQMLETHAKNSEATLKNLKGGEFDKAYIDQEIAFHQTALDTIDEQLLPQAKSSELKNLLEKVKPSIQAHLEHARQLQDQLGAKASA